MKKKESRFITTMGAVEEVFHIVRPLGGTPTGTRLHYVLQPYLERVEAQARLTASGATSEPVKPLNIIVITDGVPSDDVESVIVRAAKRLDACNAEPWQVGIQFFQVGNEPEAAEELRELDDGLASQEGVRRRVGGEGFEKAFVLGIRCDSFGLQPFPLFDNFDGGLGAEPSALSRPLEISQNVVTADMPCEVRSPPIQHQLLPSVQDQPPPAEQEAISPSGQEKTATSSQEPPAGRHTTTTVTQDPSSREDRDALSSIPGQVSETVKANQCGHLQTDSKEKSIRTLPTLDIVWPAELHTCVICSVSFARARELTDHQNSTHPHPDFTYEFCKKQFAKREGLSLHKGKAHRKKVECTTRVMKGATARLKSPLKNKH
jgi:hypothetical protein